MAASTESTSGEVVPSAGYMFSAALGAGIGLAGGYAISRPYFYKWATAENMDLLKSLAAEAEVELKEIDDKFEELDAVTNEVE